MLRQSRVNGNVTDHIARDQQEVTGYEVTLVEVTHSVANGGGDGLEDDECRKGRRGELPSRGAVVVQHVDRSMVEGTAYLM